MLSNIVKQHNQRYQAWKEKELRLDHEEAWRRASEYLFLRVDHSERTRLMLEGRIIPVEYIWPQVMVKVGGEWRPEIKYV